MLTFRPEMLARAEGAILRSSQQGTATALDFAFGGFPLRSWAAQILHGRRAILPQMNAIPIRLVLLRHWPLFAILAVLILALFGYLGSVAGLAHYRESRAHEEKIRSDDDELREWAAQPTDDPLLAKLRECIERLTFTKNGGYAEVNGAAAKGCWEAHAKASKAKFDAEVDALGAKINELDEDDKARLYDECFVEANADISQCYKTVYGPK